MSPLIDPASNGYSPLLSVLTAALELALAAWAWRSGRRPEVRLPVVALLLVLAGYQVAEVWVCRAPDDPWRARLAFVDVTWLPVLGLHLLAVLSGARPALRRLVALQWVAAAGFSAWVLLDHRFVVGTVCSTVIATYRHGTPFHHLYGAWYESCLLGIVVGCAVAAVRSEDRDLRAQLVALQLGVLGFVVPAFFVQIVWKAIDPSLPSLMCHFAVVLAVALVVLLRREPRIARGPSTGTAGR